MNIRTVVIMGVSGSGKTTIGSLLAEKTGFSFADADDFHPRSNIEKMARGEPLSDADRAGWLVSLREQIDLVVAAGQRIVLACSALKEEYRQALGPERPGFAFVYLRASLELVRERMAKREGHFMPTSLAVSQFVALEEPKDAVVVDAAKTPLEIVHEIQSRLGLESVDSPK